MTFVFDWPQVVYLIFAVCTLLVNVAKAQGDWAKIVGALGGMLLMLFILYKGGFFTLVPCAMEVYP